MQPVLEVNNLSVQYGKVQALQVGRIEVRQSQIVTVIGRNGAGKSTLLKAIMGLMGSEGELRYMGAFLADVSVEERVREGLCLVPERLELFGNMSVEDNLILGGYLLYLRDTKAALAELDQIYRQFPRLRERRMQHASTLSGGERQMLGLGRALMAKPKLLMLDEPSLGLAPLIVREIFLKIGELRDQGVSVLLIEQNAKAALELADYAYVLETGTVTLQGEAGALAQDRRVAETYLGVNAARTR
jgi:branched-chain amino acid transport system ATP-binding protein